MGVIETFPDELKNADYRLDALGKMSFLTGAMKEELELFEKEDEMTLPMKFSRIASLRGGASLLIKLIGDSFRRCSCTAS